MEDLLGEASEEYEEFMRSLDDPELVMNPSSESMTRPPLHSAAYYNSAEAVKICLQRGALVNAVFMGTTPLHRAVSRNNTEVVELLLANGADVNLRSEIVDGNDQVLPLPTTALHAATSPEMVRLLFAHGADPSLLDAEESTVLHNALLFESDYRDVFPLLLEHGAPLDAQNKEGRTALMVAAKENYVEAVTMLLDHGADISARTHNNNTYGESVLNEAVAHPELCALLISRGADPIALARDTHTMYPLHSIVDSTDTQRLLRHPLLLPFLDGVHSGDLNLERYLISNPMTTQKIIGLTFSAVGMHPAIADDTTWLTIFRVIGQVVHYNWPSATNAMSRLVSRVFDDVGIEQQRWRPEESSGGGKRKKGEAKRGRS